MKSALFRTTLLPQVLLFLAIACTSGEETGSKQTIDAAQARKKVSTHILQLSEKLDNGGWTSEQLARNLPGSAIVRVDSTASIHCYVYLKDISHSNLEQLEAWFTKTETVNQELKIVQGWIHYKNIITVAQLPFVKNIVAPEYGETL